jgi:hypothetical protein
MGILTLGLLGVAAIFPVASFYMHKADVADRGSAIAQAVMNDIVARGMLNPGVWYMQVPDAGAIFPSDGKYSPIPPPVSSSKVRGTFTRPFALSLSDALRQPASVTDPTLVGKQFGAAYVIDPMGVAEMGWPNAFNANLTLNGTSAMFPSSAYLIRFTYGGWQAWGTTWPIRRVTFRQPNTGWHMNSVTAEHYFRGSDDLASDLPDRDDRPAEQNWDTLPLGPAGAAMPAARQWAGDYSWLVTVVPTTTAARDGMAHNPEGHAYDVSVVVFYKRAFPPGAAQVFTSSTGAPDFLATMGGYERAVTAKIVSTGLSGGEVLLEALPDGISESPYDSLRTGQWIMLCGPHPNSSNSEPRFSLNWYQVVTVDTNAPGVIDPAKAAMQRVVALRGPQWPWQPAANLTSVAEPSNNLCVGICRGAVAVHTKTLRLENPRTSTVSFGAGGDPSINPPKWVFF